MKYTEEERRFFTEYVPGHSYKEIQAEFTKRFGRNIGLNQVKGYVGNHKLDTGRTGRFEKGHISANKGKKMSAEAYEKAKATMFKKGNMPINTDPIGTEKMLGDGYIWVKVDDKPYAKKKENWKQKHRLIWEAEHGPIKEGMLIMFLNGDKTDIRLDNLALVTRGEHALMNRYGLRSKDRDMSVLGLTTAKLMSKITEVKK